MNNLQHHAQDSLGQYDYGYSNSLSSKSEIKTADGVVRGTYSYVDANNIVQTVNYLSDDLGFRVQATNLPGRVSFEIGVQSTTRDISKLNFFRNLAHQSFRIMLPKLLFKQLLNLLNKKLNKLKLYLPLLNKNLFNMLTKTNSFLMTI